jgi:prolyl 4-hydroxylase
MGFSSPSPSSSSRSASASSASSSFSVFTVIQYAFLSLAAYVLVGAPLLEMLGRGGSSLEASRGASVGSMSPAKLESIAPVDANLTCAPHAFKNVHVLSREPLVVYIEGFLSPEETDEVVALR